MMKNEGREKKVMRYIEIFAHTIFFMGGLSRTLWQNGKANKY